MNNKLITAVIIIALGVSGCITSETDQEPEKEGLPSSLDQYYATYPPEYLIKMFELAESMVGITVNIQQGDMENAKRSFEVFSQDYKENAEMVPEWKKYYNQTAVEKIGVFI